MPRRWSRPRGSATDRALPGTWHVALLLLLISVAGCVNWSDAAPPTPQEFPARQQVKVWAGDSSIRLQSVRFTTDSISGTPYNDPPACDSCRVAIALAQVDSLQSGKSPETLSMVLIIGIPVVALTVLTLGLSGMD